MSTLSEIAPQQKRFTMDLLDEAGFDVSDWKNTKGHPRANPKYCYEWAFYEEGKGAVLNLWHEHFIEENSEIIYRGNVREEQEAATKTNWKKRAGKVDAALQQVWKQNLPLRIILLVGDLGRYETQTASTVIYRDIDPEFWSIQKYDDNTGEFELVRGDPTHPKFCDQFSDPDIGSEKPSQSAQSVQRFNRNPKVREWVLGRANGKCEYCGQSGFEMTSGAIYLETHHIVPLATGGPDIISNVIALCPNHHKEAHYGSEHKCLAKKFQKIISPP